MSAQPSGHLDKIQISPTGYAHVPGACVHYPDKPLEEAGWGWVHDVTANMWTGIAEHRPLRAAEGDTALSATRRCSHCARRIDLS
ncbi:hypothetical protein [Streptomyces venezuelae]|uniref:hypothetical protein n=1 Tax=Streptomyces venezuelae TaxID=54571 RepID=UPI0037AE7582